MKPTRARLYDFGRPSSCRAELDKNRTHVKFIYHLVQIKNLRLYLSKLLEIGHFEVFSKKLKIWKIFIGFSMKISKNRKFSKNRKIENRDFRFSDFRFFDFSIFRFFRKLRFFEIFIENPMKILIFWRDFGPIPEIWRSQLQNDLARKLGWHRIWIFFWAILYT